MLENALLERSRLTYLCVAAFRTSAIPEILLTFNLTVKGFL
jgi:hypothetical protein